MAAATAAGCVPSPTDQSGTLAKSVDDYESGLIAGRENIHPSAKSYRILWKRPLISGTYKS